MLPTVVVTRPKADIYMDAALREYHGCVRMGATLAAGGGDAPAAAMEVIVPLRDEAGGVSFRKCYVLKDAVSVGYLPYTARSIIGQAFELLHEPYGWGDTRGAQDCSRFIQEIFATVGIILPRNSEDQARAGVSLATFGSADGENERLAVLREKAAGGTTLLYFKGHIMLYLGMAGDVPYAIHALWAYRQKAPSGERVHSVSRVAVSDLSLGKGSSKGSLLERLSAVRMVSN